MFCTFPKLGEHVVTVEIPNSGGLDLLLRLAFGLQLLGTQLAMVVKSCSQPLLPDRVELDGFVEASSFGGDPLFEGGQRKGEVTPGIVILCSNRGDDVRDIEVDEMIVSENLWAFHY